MSQGTKRLRQDGILNVWKAYEGYALQIAEEYNIPRQSVYKILKDYCIENGLVYENLLRQPHKPHRPYVYKVIRRQKKQTSNEKPIKIKRLTRNYNVFLSCGNDKNIDYVIATLKSSTAGNIEDMIGCTKLLIAIAENMGGKR